jgi:hypothetical protein
MVKLPKVGSNGIVPVPVGAGPNKEKVAPDTEMHQGFKSQQLTLIRDLILFC